VPIPYVISDGAQCYLRSTRLILPIALGALSPGTDPDRMKGALYVLKNKGIGMLLSFPI